MLRVLVLGGNGMLGHKLWQAWRSRFDTYVTLRQSFDYYSPYQIFERTRVVEHVTVENFDSVAQAIANVHPHVVVNSIALVKQRQEANDPLSNILVNALFPHRLAKLCQAGGVRLIHISTDCVFSGKRGNYSESDIPDPIDLYGRTKLLGEVNYEGCLTLRTSMIGRELRGVQGLIEWFLSQRGKTVQGYKKAIFSGFTTNTLAEIINQVIIDYPNLQGIWHVASNPISKYELLQIVKQTYRLDITIEPDESVVIDRSLNMDRFQAATGFISPTWHDMIAQMYTDPTPYSKLRRSNANQ